MKTIKFLSTFFILHFTFSISNAQHTFSIVAVDSATGEVGSAGASCLTGSSVDVSIISDLIPGRGAVNAQAQVCIPNINLNNAIMWMGFGNSPQQILNLLMANDTCTFGDTSYRQYGIADFDSSGSPRALGYTGLNCSDYKNHNVGPNYSIQGNILLGQSILDSMEFRFNNTPEELADKLMAALQGANKPGADTRCAPYNTSATSAFIRVAKPGDSTSDLYLEIILPNLSSGKEPIDSLQKLFDIWKLSQSIADEFQKGKTSVVIYPNPFTASATLRINSPLIKGDKGGCQFKMYDLLGRQVLHNPLTPFDKGEYGMTIERGNLPAGIYFYKVTDKSKILGTGKIIIQ